MDFFQVVTTKSQHINNTEQKIISYCIENSQKFSHMKIVELSEELFVSPNTIIRLAQKLGYRGFSEMKYAISNTSNSRELIVSDTFDIIEAMQKTKDLIDYTIIEKMVDDIKQAGKICIFASGLSRYAAFPFVKKMQYLNRLVLLSEDRDSSRLLAENLSENDVAIFLTLSAKTETILESYHIALQKKAKISVITGLGQSLLSHENQTIYIYSKNRFKNDIDFTSRMPMEYIFEYIFDIYFKKEISASS